MTDADPNSKPSDAFPPNKDAAGDAEPLPEAVEPDPELTPEEAEQARKKYLLKRFWISARGYWSRHGDKLAWVCSIGLLTLIGINVGFQYGINVWNRSIFDAIEKRDAGTVYFLSAVFIPLVFGSMSLVVIQVAIRMMIQRRWRSWLTKGLAAITRTRKRAFRRICALRLSHRSISSQASFPPFCRPRPS